MKTCNMHVYLPLFLLRENLGMVLQSGQYHLFERGTLIILRHSK